MLTPNSWLHPSFGKYIFALCDIVNGILIYRLLKSNILKNNDATERLATIYSAVHLLNPLVFSISTRGSSESVLSSFILLTLYAALKGHWDLSAILLGLSTHWKIYPVIYGVGCLGVVGEGIGKSHLHTFVNTKSIRFAVISAGTFVLLGIGCYGM